MKQNLFFTGLLALMMMLSHEGWGQNLFETFSDGNFSSNPVWSGNTSSWEIVANSDAAAGATGSNTLRLNFTTSSAGTQYLSTQIGSWGSTQEWGFWIGRRSQAYTAANQMHIWLYANEDNLTSATVDGYRIAIGDDTGDDDLRLEYIVNGAVSSTVIASAGTIPNGLTDIGFLVRVKRSSSGAWEVFTSTLPSSSGTGAIATDIPNSTNAPTSRGTGTNNSLVPSANGYFGVLAIHSSGAAARVAVEFDQIYFTIDPTITLNNNTQITAGNVNQGATDHLLSRFSINVASANATLNQISFAAGGTFEAGDITNFKLYTSTTNTFPGGTPLASVAAGAIANNGTVTFSSLSQVCAIGDRYFWIAADVSATAGETRTVSVPSLSASNFTFALGTPTGTIDAGGAQTFVAVTPGIELSSPSPSTVDITQGISNQVVYRFDLAVTVANAVLNGVTITTAGTYIASDLTNLKCWYSADNSFNSGTDELLSTKTTSLGTGAQVFPSFSSKTINEGTTGYMFITVDLPVSAIENNTISVNAITTSDISFVSGNKTGTANASGTKTIIACTPTNVTGLGLTPGNAQIVVSWTNPACYDEVMIVAKPTSSIGASPSGDGSAYTANLAFGTGGATAFDGTGYVVYKGSTSPQTITGLANGTIYFVRVFTRRGTTWTSGEESSTSPIFASSSSDYFRSKATGDWNATGSWESSSNGSDWFNATLTPTSSANTITIRNNHTVTINANVTVDQVIIESGGVLTYTAGTLTVANGTGHDIQVNDGGIFALSIASTPPSFNADASCLISTGGMLRVAASGLTANGAGVNLANFVYENASILEYTPTSAFSASGVTFFPNADASTIPIFRITALTSPPGGGSNLIINGIIEANSSFSWNGTGTKTFRNGIRGTGTMTQSTTGQWIISGSTAELNGSGALSLGTNGLVINSGSTVTASSTKSISGGTVTNNGTLNITSDGALSMSALTNSATGVVNITGFATVTGTLTNSAGNAGLVVASGGSLIHSTASLPGTVQRHVVSHGNVATDGWHLIGSPVATFTINGSSFDPGTNDDLYAWDEATNTWLNHKAGNPTQIVPGTGYIVAYENTGTKSFTGNLNVSDVAVSGLAHTAAQGKGWHLLGNPFASALEWNKTGGSWALTNVAGTAKVWNSATKAYVDVVADGIIPSAQGFFVQVNESTTGSLTIPAAARAHSSTAWYKNTTPRLMLSASPTDGSSRQESQIRIEPEATSSFDFYYDSRFLPGYAPQFYSMSGGEMLSSNALPQVQNGASIPLGFVKNQHESFVIRLEENNIGETVLIKDLKLNLTHNLSQQPEYHFTSAQGDDPNRFLLHFGAVGVDETIPETAIAAYVSNNILYVLNAQGKVQVDVLDLSGRMVYSQSMQAEGLSSTPINLSAGVYVVRLNDGQTTMANKVIVQ